MTKNVLKNADAINFTTHRSRMLVMKKYPFDWLNKTYVTPHSYDKALYKSTNAKHINDKLIINYLGNFYGPRNPTTLIEALKSIYEENNDFFQGIVFRFIGKWIGNEDWKFINDDLPNDLIEIVPPIPYCDSLAEMSNSDLLLILDAPFTSSVFFPSKLVDYIGAGKPIFAITPKGSCLDILEKVGGLQAYPESVDSIANGIIEAVTKLKKGILVFPSIDTSERYSNSYVSREFEILFQQAIRD